MVKVYINSYGFSVQGHANYDEYGFDIVCSAISAISQSVALAIKKYGKAKVRTTSGWVSVDLEEFSKETDILIDVLRMGLLEIEKEYPKHLEVRVAKGVR
jgi:uncharacterized protein YsxB (DUF464 family)